MSEQTFDSILAIETSTTHLKLGLSFGGDRLVKSDDEVERSHGQVIIRKIGNLLSSAGLQASDLNALVVSTGPGSFTGLRIGLAAAKGMAMALRIPIVGVSLFDLAAFKYRELSTPVNVVVQVRRDEALVGNVVRGTFDITSVSAIPITALNDHLRNQHAVGIGLDILTLAPSCSATLGEGELEVDTADLVYIGLTELLAGRFADIATLEPMYLQKSQAEIRFEQRQQRQ